MRKFLWRLTLLSQVAVISLLAILDYVGFRPIFVFPYVVMLLSIIIPAIGSRLVIKKQFLGEMEKELLEYLLREEEAGREVRKAQWLYGSKGTFGIRKTENVYRNFLRLKFICEEKIRKGNERFTKVSSTWRLKLVLDL